VSTIGSVETGIGAVGGAGAILIGVIGLTGSGIVLNGCVFFI